MLLSSLKKRGLFVRLHKTRFWGFCLFQITFFFFFFLLKGDFGAFLKFFGVFQRGKERNSRGLNVVNGKHRSQLEGKKIRKNLKNQREMFFSFLFRPALSVFIRVKHPGHNGKDGALPAKYWGTGRASGRELNPGVRCWARGSSPSVSPTWGKSAPKMLRG